MKDNWYALVISIVTKKSVNKSLIEMGIKLQIKEHATLNLNESDIKLIKFLKEQHTWDEIAEMCNVKTSYIYSIVNKKKNAEELIKAPRQIRLNKISIPV